MKDLGPSREYRCLLGVLMYLLQSRRLLESLGFSGRQIMLPGHSFLCMSVLFCFVPSRVCSCWHLRLWFVCFSWNSGLSFHARSLLKGGLILLQFSLLLAGIEMRGLVV